VAVALVAALGGLGLRLFVVETFWIPSASMEPALHGCRTCNEDRMLVNKLSYRLHSVHRADVVVFARPAGSTATESHLVKRVIGLPGETVNGHDGAVWIGGRRLAEPYVAAGCRGTADFTAVTVPPGRVFVLGDNRCDSADSRSFGPIRESTITGRAFVVFWPLSRLHWL
jgi:signal peptidase I